MTIERFIFIVRPADSQIWLSRRNRKIFYAFVTLFVISMPASAVIDLIFTEGTVSTHTQKVKTNLPEKAS